MRDDENRRPLPGYEPEYQKAAEKTEVYYYHVASDEKYRGLLNGKSPKEVVEIYNSIKKCKCGGTPECLQIECMGEFDFSITCKSCGRRITRNIFDKLPGEPADEINRCIADWNDGKEQADIDAEHEKKYERRRIHSDDLYWKPLYANNMKSNPLIGYYCLIFEKNDYNEFYSGCKWTIILQKEEKEPMWIRTDSKIDAYILFMKRYLDEQAPFDFPEPESFEEEIEKKPEHIRSFDFENGDFVRSYRTLEEAEEGAAARCGWQGFNRETVIRLGNQEVEKAAMLSRQLFADKKDLAGVEYYKHPEAVAEMVESDMEKIVAYLHDVLEDTDYPEEKMREEFGDSVTDAVRLLTHKEKLDKQGYLDYIQKLKKTENQVAIHVKIADLKHNSDISRLGANTFEDLTTKQKERYQKYQEALEILEGKGGQDGN